MCSQRLVHLTYYPTLWTLGCGWQAPRRRIATAFSWPTQAGTTPRVAFRARLDPGAATTVRVIASRNDAADGSKEVEFEM
jgi:hypothetical protein